MVLAVLPLGKARNYPEHGQALSHGLELLLGLDAIVEELAHQDIGHREEQAEETRQDGVNEWLG